MMKKKGILIVILLIGTYTFGAVTAHYKLFPFKEILAYKNLKDNTTLSLPIYEQNFNYRWLTDMYNNAYKTKTADIVMLGDSITSIANWNELLNNYKIVNRGIGNDITEGFLNRLDNIIKLKPKEVFIMGGINDIIMGVSVNEIYENYTKIIIELKKHNIKSTIQSTLFTRKLEHKDKILLLNRKLKKYAKEHNLKFIDLNKVLSKDNYLLEKYTIDGIHLNAEGYNLWKQAIISHIGEETYNEEV